MPKASTAASDQSETRRTTGDMTTDSRPARPWLRRRADRLANMPTAGSIQRTQSGRKLGATAGTSRARPGYTGGEALLGRRVGGAATKVPITRSPNSEYATVKTHGAARKRAVHAARSRENPPVARQFVRPARGAIAPRWSAGRRSSPRPRRRRIRIIARCVTGCRRADPRPFPRDPPPDHDQAQNDERDDATWAATTMSAVSR